MSEGPLTGLLGEAARVDDGVGNAHAFQVLLGLRLPHQNAPVPNLRTRGKGDIERVISTVFRESRDLGMLWRVKVSVVYAGGCGGCCGGLMGRWRV